MCVQLYMRVGLCNTVNSILCSIASEHMCCFVSVCDGLMEGCVGLRIQYYYNTVLTDGELCGGGSCVSIRVDPSDEKCMATCQQCTDVNLQRRRACI